VHAREAEGAGEAAGWRAGVITEEVSRRNVSVATDRPRNANGLPEMIIRSEGRYDLADK
jgi:hypothetical protein